MAIILAVDDSKVIIKQYERYAKEYFPEATFVSANDGVDALEIVKKLEDEVMFAIIDYNMKIMDGIELVENIKDIIDPEKMVICSANLQQSLQVKIEELGIGFVSKPVSSDKFKQIIEIINSKK